MICEVCGKEFFEDWRTDKKHKKKTTCRFCSPSCAHSYTSSLTKEKTKEIICSSCGKPYIASIHTPYATKCNDCKKKKKSNVIAQKEEDRECLNCGKRITSKNKKTKYCSQDCYREHRHRSKYKEFLEHNDKYCKVNYVIRPFYKDFMREQDYVCSICGCSPTHNGKPLVFICDHIDGDASNNRRSNLRMICPNCDSQLDTYKSKNKNSARKFRKKYR